MANGYTVLHGNAFERVEQQLCADGYRLEFACTHTEPQPADLGITGKEGGREKRRKIKAWCQAHSLTNFKIVRNTGYVRDLHGDVYELWVRPSGQASVAN